MALTVRTNGSGSTNIITAAWFNDYYNLLTGAMQDQEVNIKNVLTLTAIGAAPSSAPTFALASGTTLGIGVYQYEYTYANADGESAPSPFVSVTTTSGNQKVNLSGITVGPTGTTKRNVYRTAVGGGTWKFVASINDNTTTTYSDTLPDGSLGAANSGSSSFGGSLQIRNAAGTKTFQLNNDGSIPTALTAINPANYILATQLQDVVNVPGYRLGGVTAGDMLDFTTVNSIVKGGPGGGLIFNDQSTNQWSIKAMRNGSSNQGAGTDATITHGMVVNGVATQPDIVILSTANSVNTPGTYNAFSYSTTQFSIHNGASASMIIRWLAIKF